MFGKPKKGLCISVMCYTVFYTLIQQFSTLTQDTGNQTQCFYLSKESPPFPFLGECLPPSDKRVSCIGALSTPSVEMRSLFLNYLNTHGEGGKRDNHSVSWWLRQPEENLAICSSPCSKNGSYFFIQQLFYIAPYSRAAYRNILPRPRGV